MSKSAQAEEQAVMTDLQKLVIAEIQAQTPSIRIFNAQHIKGSAHSIEVDTIFPDYGTVIEWWHSKDPRYRRKGKQHGVLRSSRYDKDVEKTAFYRSRGWHCFWIDQAKYSAERQADVIHLVKTIMTVLEWTRFHPKEIGVEDFEYL